MRDCFLDASIVAVVGELFCVSTAIILLLITSKCFRHCTDCPNQSEFQVF